MKIIISASFLVILINNALAQYAYTIGPTIPAAPTQVSKQQLINYLLSSFNQAPLSERIDVLTTAVQQLPPKRNRRVHLADVLKNSALQSLMVASSVCNDATLGTEYTAPLQGYALPSYAQARNFAVPNELSNYAALPRQKLIVANEQLSDYGAPLSRNLVVANPNELSNYASLPRNLVLAPTSEQLSNFVPLQRQNLGLASNEAPLVANRDLLSALIPRELLSSLVVDSPNRMRF